ncbi:HNH endonuclease signature motif containing protein [Streptomyces sp. NPDC091412]|uniref:HNH endonuclease signature motif containing protein n=1 Tax=Streptomyces sp. NPDC091412 TaxID=3366002 RepID=UPI0037F19A17
MIVCRVCKTEKAETEFHRSKTTITGRRNECKACRKAERRSRYEVNRDTERAQMLAYRSVDAHRESARRRAREHKEAARQDPAYRKRETDLNREWRRRNPDKMAAANARQRNRGRFSPDWTPEEWNALLDLYDHRCLACDGPGPLQPDHVVPLSWPGASNGIDNIQPLCGPCNRRKSDKHIDYRPAGHRLPSVPAQVTLFDLASEGQDT